MTPTPVDAAQAGVRVRGLEKSYRTSKGMINAVRGIDFELAPGETVALLGPNGAGKSTTLEMLLGLTRPDAGEATLFGREPTEAVASGAVGAMLQTAGLLRDLSVRELITMLSSLYPAPLRTDEVLELTGLSEIADQRTEKLSGGQAQRVRFAIALASNPDLIILDEPTSAMDVEARRSFWTAMRDLAARGKTVVFATHYIEEADAYADRVILMSEGRIVADGPPTAIKALVGSRTIHATLADADAGALGALAGVTAVDVHGQAVILTCVDSDTAIRELLTHFPAARDIEIKGAQLEDAFLQLTTGQNDETASRARQVEANR